MKQGIILAAGLGRRLREITQHTPKSLIQINGKPVIEQNIEWMLDSGVDLIFLVTGYMQERFSYLGQKYPNLQIFFNPDYATSNTVSSLNIVKDYLTEESYITTADIYIAKNIYLDYQDPQSFYLLRPKTTEKKPDWIAEVNESGRIVSVDQKGLAGHTYSGVSHWMPAELAELRILLSKVDWKDKRQRNQYWDELLLPHLQSICVNACILQNNADIYEFDDMDDLQRLMNEQQVEVTW